ncbi:MAG: tetratricopeptide repeat protein [Bacteroidota bacterium]
MKPHPILILVVYLLVNASTPIIDQGQFFFNEARYDSAINYFEKAEQLALKSSDWTSVIDSRLKLAETYRVINNTQKSLAYLDSAYAVLNDHVAKPEKIGNQIVKSFGHDHFEQIAKALEINGRVLDYNLRQFDNAKVYYDSSLEIRKRLYGNEHMTISENIFLLGRIDFFKGQLEQASEKYLQAVDMKRKLGGDNEISLFDPYQSLGALNRRQLKMDESLKYYKKAEAIWEHNKRPADHPSYAMMVYGLGNLSIETGMYEDAKQNYRNAVTTFEKFFGPNDFRVATSYANIAACYRNQLEFANAEQYYLKAHDIYTKALSEDHPFIVTSLSDLADMYHLFGYFDESSKYSERAIQLMEKYQEKKGNRDLAITKFVLRHKSCRSQKNI